MMEHVVFRDHDGWFKLTFGHWWDDPRHWMGDERIDTRLLIARFDTRQEADELKVVYNMMMHKRPHRWATKGEY